MMLNTLSSAAPTNQALEAVMKTHFIGLAPPRITHLLTFTFGRNVNPMVFNRDYLHQAGEIHRVIIDTLDDVIYRPSGVKKRPRGIRFAFLSKGETRSKTRRLAHLHFHFLVDLGGEAETQRFMSLKKKYQDRLFRKLDCRFGLKVRIHTVKIRPGTYSHERITDYLAKEILTDSERIYTRQTY